MANNFFYTAGSNSGLSGKVEFHSNLPTPDIAYADQFWLVSKNSGVQFPTPSKSLWKYPKGIYSLNSTNTEWILVPVNVHVSEDSTTFINITDWVSYADWMKDINLGDVIIYNTVMYSNLVGAWTTIPPDIDTTNWKPFANINNVTWLYEYESGTYPKNTMTRIGDWTTISNKETEEYPVPQYSGEEFNIYDGTMPQNQVTVKQVIFGSRYVADLSAYIKGYRIFVVAGNTYDIYSVIDPLGAGILSFELGFEATTSGWIDISLAPTLVIAGNSFDYVAVVREPDPTPTTFNGQWNYIKPNNPTVPLVGQINHSSKELNKLQINYIDDALVDRKAELLTLTVGDIINTDEINWAIQAIVDNGSYITFDIAPSTQLFITGIQTFTFETTVTTPITYGVDLDYYLTNPNVQGLFIADDSYDNIVPDDNAYGIDILVQEVVQSEDWDIVASSANLGGGGNKKAVDFLDQIEVTTEGDDKGVIFKNQISNGSWDKPNEAVFGSGDSTTETMAILQTDNDVAYTNITIEAASDTGSTFGLFNGTVPGKTIYAGADFPFSGVKIKINTDGLVEPSNVIAEFWDGTQWQGVFFMSTAGDELFQYGWQIAQNGNVTEQWYFNFDPYNEFDEFSKTIVNGIEKYWARFRIVNNITTDPILEQIKLHTSRWECNGNGKTQYFGAGRYIKTLLSGINSLINNAALSPANEAVNYAPLVIAGYQDNQLNNNANDSRLFVLNVDEGLDTSVKIELKISWYVMGVSTGNVEFTLGKIPVGDGFVYDGTGTVENIVSEITTVDISSNLVRMTSTILMPINDAGPDVGAYLMVLGRDATAGNPNDTLQGNIVLTHIVVNGYFWKP